MKNIDMLNLRHALSIMSFEQGRLRILVDQWGIKNIHQEIPLDEIEAELRGILERLKRGGWRDQEHDGGCAMTRQITIDRWKDIEAAQGIVTEECDRIQDALFDAIRKRIKAELGSRMKIIRPKRAYAYATRSGPKVIDFPKMDINTHERIMVMPVCTLEAKVKLGID